MADPIDWTDAFENSAYIPRADQYRAQWPERSKAFRDGHADKELGIAYGSGARQAFDLFRTEQSKGCVIFVHGGYWHQTDRSMWSQLAQGPLAHGWSVALPSYTLAPEAKIRDITQEISAAVCRVADRVDGPLRLIGHSAGGHLVSRMVCRDTLPEDVRARIEHTVSLSGVHHLPPLMQAKMNEILHLDAEEAVAESPALLAPAPDTRITFFVGAAERPEFLRQTRMIGEAWAAQGALVREIYAEGHDHFSVVDTLSDPDSTLTAELLSDPG